MTNHLAIIAGVGAAILFMSWLPSLSRKLQISYPIILIAIGLVLYYIGVPLDWPDPLWDDKAVVTISEAIVVISLMGAGLKIPRIKGWKFWWIPARLLLIAMPLTMLGVFLLGTELLGLSFAGSIMLAAVLAPTDPVLAAEVQLAEPGEVHPEEEPPETEFALTAEAGLNDGLAFPFTWLAVLVFQAGSWEAFSLTDWLWDEFAIKIALGAILGVVITWLVIKFHDWLRGAFEIKTRDGLLAFALAAVVYSVTELLYGYGFLAAFVSAIVLKYTRSMDDGYKELLHDFVDQVERVLLVIWLVLFGGSMMNGLLALGGWNALWVALLLIFVVRPVSGFLSLIGKNLKLREKVAISFFGIRGIGSIFYLSWAAVQLGDFAEKEYLYGILGVIILCSIVIHGISAPWVFGNKIHKDDYGPS